MSAAPETRRSQLPKPRRRFYRRWWFWVIIGVVVLGGLAIVAGVVGARALEVRSELESAQALTGTLKEQALELDIAAATETLAEIEEHTDRATALADGALWNFAEAVPVLGRNFSAVRELAAVTDAVMADVARPLLGVAGSLDPASFAPKDGAIDIQPLIEAVPVLARADAGLDGAIARVDKVDTSVTIDQVSAAKDKLARLLASTAPMVSTLNDIVPLLPPALGADAPRTYVVMFQNNAESRALGGTALSFAVVSIDKGKIDLADAVPAGFSNFSSGVQVIPVPDGVEELYGPGVFGTFIANATSRPSFTSAGQITQEMWKRDQGYAIDGVLSIDPVALSYVLRATDPITLSTGDVLTSDSLVPILLNDVYQRFNSGNVGLDNMRQDVVYNEAVGATFSKLTSGALDPATFIAALAQGWDERRVLYWSAHEDEQAQLAAIGLNGELPVSDEETERVGVYFSDNVGSKLNFYLQQAVSLSQGACRADGIQSYRVGVQFTSTLQPAQVSTLSPSITGAWKREGLTPGVQRMQVFLYAPPGATITGATIDGAPVTLDPHHDTDYPVGKLTVSVEPGATVAMTYDIVAAEAGEKVLDAFITPMVNPTTVTTEALDCSTVSGG